MACTHRGVHTSYHGLGRRKNEVSEDIQSYVGGSSFSSDICSTGPVKHIPCRIVVRWKMASDANQFERRVGCIGAVFVFRRETPVSDIVRMVNIIASYNTQEFQFVFWMSRHFLT